jgi:hypothetical protein
MKRLPWTISLMLASACFNPPAVETTTTTGPSTDSDTGTTEVPADDTSMGDTGSPPPCTDGIQGGDETDVDCGGSCDPCGDGQGCMVAEDCSSEVCEGQVCQAAACGDGVVQAGEGCDDAGESATCNADCTEASCGDGALNATAGEACDDAGESATCNADCTEASCGDGVLNATAGEACDEGSETATCDSDCTAVVCGDGLANAVVGEQCDDGGESAACDADCTTAACGDGTINATAGEDCEGGSPDICGADCLYTGCAPDPVALALAACMAQFPSCDVVDGGVVGYGPPECAGCNCGPPSDPWRFYCTATSGTNFNCSACSVGQILGPHDPCNCDPGTSPVLGSFCTL